MRVYRIALPKVRFLCTRSCSDQLHHAVGHGLGHDPGSVIARTIYPLYDPGLGSGENPLACEQYRLAAIAVVAVTRTGEVVG